MKDELTRKDAMLGSLRQQVIDLTATGGAGHRAQYELFEQQHRLREDELHRSICMHLNTIYELCRMIHLGFIGTC